MNEKKRVSKNVRHSRNNKCKQLKKLRKARDIASRDATIIRRRKVVWKLKYLVPHYIHIVDYLSVENLAERIYLRTAPPIPIKAKK